ncbi:unnamed protein product [Owenia fusiformis]|uniref:Transient receptor ion channel domain-containing protein n=1 Tax=Owenia fusiformis TaxID=6347 RepID=A0A8S4N776_OWEFU|nr:unnamed protein product [Owenia fusiformis]
MKLRKQDKNKNDEVDKGKGENDFWHQFVKSRAESIQSLNAGEQELLYLVTEGDVQGVQGHIEELLYLVTEGDVQGVQGHIESHTTIDINTTDYQGRTPLTIAVQNQHEDMVYNLIQCPNIVLGDSLLHAIKEGNVRIIEVLLNWQDENHRKTKQVDAFDSPEDENATEAFESAEFSANITPLMLAAHCHNYEVIQKLIARGDTIEIPHQVNCDCKDCKRADDEFECFGEFLEVSKLRIDAYKALASPAYICLTSEDPILTAFQLAHEFDKLFIDEPIFRQQYQDLSKQCREFATELLDESRTSEEIYYILTRKEGAEKINIGSKTMQFSRLQMAIDYGMKEFVTHPHCQQVLQTLWTKHLPDLMHKHFCQQLGYFILFVLALPFTTIAYLFCPGLDCLQILKAPINNFLRDICSYLFFCAILLADTVKPFTTQRGLGTKTILEWLVILYVVGFLWAKVKQIYNEGPRVFFREKWNWYDLLMITVFLLTFLFWTISFFEVAKHGGADIPRRYWKWNDPLLIAEGLYSFATVMAFGRILYIFQISQILGPLQLMLDGMMLDIMQAFILFVVIIVTFSCGITKLYTNYEDHVRFDVETGESEQQAPEFTRFYKSLATLFWALFGFAEPGYANVIVGNVYNETMTTKMNYHTFTEMMGLILFGMYQILVVIVVVNMLIAMMSNTLNRIEENVDMEWKFARSKLWMQYFEAQGTLPPPMNLIPSPKSILKLIRFLCCCMACRRKSEKQTVVKCSMKKCCHEEETVPLEESEKTNVKYERLVAILVHRYMNRKENEKDQEDVTPDDIETLHQDLLREMEKINLKISLLFTRSDKNHIVHSPSKKHAHKPGHVTFEKPVYVNEIDQ